MKVRVKTYSELERKYGMCVTMSEFGAVEFDSSGRMEGGAIVFSDMSKYCGRIIDVIAVPELRWNDWKRNGCITAYAIGEYTDDYHIFPDYALDFRPNECQHHNTKEFTSIYSTQKRCLTCGAKL